MKTASQIAQDILSSNLSTDDLRVLNEAIKEAWDANARRAKFKFRVGDKVKWVGRAGAQTGVVTKIAIKNIQVKADNGVNWNVSATMLQAA